MNAGCERILSSGLASDALQGAETLNKMVKQVNGRLSIMAGAGVNASNVIDIINQSAVNEVHLSGKIEKASGIENIVNCGELAEFKHIHVTGFENIQAVVEQLS